MRDVVLSSPVGQSVARVDGPAKVTGRARYAGDVTLDGLLWGGVLRSPLPHARITRIDPSPALGLAGVAAVLTGRDVASYRFGKGIGDLPILAQDRVRFIGDRVAAVAATDPDVVQAALEAIEVEYEELPAVFDAASAMAPGAPLVHPDYASYRGAVANLPPVPNLISVECLEKGDADTGFAASDHVFENTYQFPIQHQVYLEPHVCVVSCEPDGTVRVWASVKDPFLVREQLARHLGLQEGAVIVEWAYVGGDFGGKGSLMEIPTAYALSRAARRPVKIVLSAVEEFTAANPRHAAAVTIKTGVAHDGRLQARHVQLVFDSGAYTGYKSMPGGILPAAHWSAGEYRIPYTRYESQMVYTNHVPGGHMRAPGGMQAIFAAEVDIDRIAERLGMDPLELRKLNAVEDNDLSPLGDEWHAVRLADCLAVVEARLGWKEPRPLNVGRGIAISHCSGGFGGSASRVEVHADGRIQLHTGVSDQGAGSHTILMQIVASELRVPYARIELKLDSTSVSPWDSGSAASRVTHVAGTATLRAAENARGALAELAAEFLGCTPGDVELEEDWLLERPRPHNRIGFTALLARAVAPGTPVVGEYRFMDYKRIDAPSFAAQAVELEVDPETGAVTILKIVAAHDVGTALHPMSVEGQIEGGTIQGLGAGMMEEVLMADGRVGTVSLSDYKVPTCLDVPPYEHVLLTGAPGIGPYGAKPIGELTNTMLPAAIANAVHDAVGVWITDLPITAEKVYAALHDPARVPIGVEAGSQG